MWWHAKHIHRWKAKCCSERIPCLIDNTHASGRQMCLRQSAKSLSEYDPLCPRGGHVSYPIPDSPWWTDRKWAAGRQETDPRDANTNLASGFSIICASVLAPSTLQVLHLTRDRNGIRIDFQHLVTQSPDETSSRFVFLVFFWNGLRCDFYWIIFYYNNYKKTYNIFQIALYKPRKCIQLRNRLKSKLK